MRCRRPAAPRPAGTGRRGPLPDRPVTASRSASSTTTTVPTASRIRRAHSRSSDDAADPGAMAAAPWPTRAGVLGMARTTGVPAGRPASMASVRTPAAMHSTRPVPAAASAGSTAATTSGFTAITESVPGTGSLDTDTPGTAAKTASWREGSGSTTWSSSAEAQPLAVRPTSRASPILPPPITCTRTMAIMLRGRADRPRLADESAGCERRAVFGVPKSVEKRVVCEHNPCRFGERPQTHRWIQAKRPTPGAIRL